MHCQVARIICALHLHRLTLSFSAASSHMAKPPVPYSDGVKASTEETQDSSLNQKISVSLVDISVVTIVAPHGLVGPLAG
jgi:hypothetical protein